jgi:hypothetical protein
MTESQEIRAEAVKATIAAMGNRGVFNKTISFTETFTEHVAQFERFIREADAPVKPS